MQDQVITETTRCCIRCHVLQPIENYSRRSFRKDGINSVCKACCSVALKKQAQKIRDGVYIKCQDGFKLQKAADKYVGSRFNYLEIRAIAGINRWRQILALCWCFGCGKWKIKAVNSFLKSDCPKTCGCKANISKVAVHRRNMPEYNIYGKMLQRCFNPKAKGYCYYGGRNITVADRWLGKSGFSNFMEDMGPRQSTDLSIDRINNDGNYEPRNCRWATDVQQARNQSRNHYLTWNGETRCMAEWAEKQGLPNSVLQYRLQQGWAVEKALTIPVGFRHPYGSGAWNKSKKRLAAA